MDRNTVTSFETIAIGAAASASASAVSQSFASAVEEEGRFVPGTLLNGRYRIIGLLGRGGMGEVYRATDLTLGQSVALKFLPAEAASNQRLLERFHSEVRIARVVSHPNVCRVYDIGQADGLPFISMEYVDGEDLASLLLRIGRLPADKALQTARKICAGLAAAHDRGVIHRDLKPHNIMMNKRGEVVIMDFGLAAIADQLSGVEARNGTPAYMAPEQLRGAEVTARSDIYSLGLVLYELFTGKRPFQGQSLAELLAEQESRELTSMTSIAAEIDPAVEHAIRRCLEPDPARRPSSPLAVASALPGGDALAAALAAGETPSPEAVASAGKTEGLARRYALACLAVCIMGVLAATFMRARTSALPNSGSEYSPEVLEGKARDLVRSFGWTRKPADTASQLSHRVALLRHMGGLQGGKWDAWLAVESPVQLMYREAQSQLIAWPYGDVDANNPALREGMANVTVEGHGQLRSLSAYPYEAAAQAAQPGSAESVFRAAGLDITKFTETSPAWLPRSPVDTVKAWTGPHPVLPATTLTVEIGWWKGFVTHAFVRFPWDKSTAGSESKSPGEKLRGIVFLSASAIGLLFVLLLARRNWKIGRTDRRGAFRLAAAKFLLAFVVWAGTMHPVSNTAMLGLFGGSTALWLFSAAFIWLLYLALEPAVRSRWPHSLVTWNRLLAGRWHDPQVGAHVLIGAAVGSALWATAALAETLIEGTKGYYAGGTLLQVLGTRQWIAAHASGIGNAINIGMIGFFAIFGLKLLLRRDLFAAIAAAFLFTLLQQDVIESSQWIAVGVLYLCVYAILLFVLLRLGLLTTLSTIYFVNAIGMNPLATDWKAWYAPYGIATACLLIAIAAFAFSRALGDQGLLGHDASA